MCLTTNVRGSCWCRAPTHGRITACASLPGLWGVAEIFRTFKAWQTETQRRSPVCRSWEDWDCAPHKDAPKLLRASWADALPMISDRNPDVASLVEDVMALEAPAGGCLAELRVATVRLDREGLTERPTWPELRHGKRPPVNTSCEPGEWQHGWQFWASSVSDAFFREDLHAVMPELLLAELALAHVRCGSPAVSCVAARKVAPSLASHRSSVQAAAPRWTARETQSCVFPNV